jgi:hypothetical protein
MLSQKKTHFKGISLRPKKSRRVPIRPTDMRFGGGVQYNHDTIEVSADNRRSTKTSFPVEITSENPVTTRMEVDEYHQEHEYPGFDSSVPEDADFTERVSRSSVICVSLQGPQLYAVSADSRHRRFLFRHGFLTVNNSCSISTCLKVLGCTRPIPAMFAKQTIPRV